MEVTTAEGFLQGAVWREVEYFVLVYVRHGGPPIELVKCTARAHEAAKLGRREIVSATREGPKLGAAGKHDDGQQYVQVQPSHGASSGKYRPVNFTPQKSEPGQP